MNPLFLAAVITGYFLLLIGISRFNRRHSDNSSFFLAGRSSAWYVVAFGMIGSSISGVTFISVPGMVGKGGFHYLQMVIGYLAGYWMVSRYLLPLYYRQNLTSIYSYLGDRFGRASHLTGSVLFLISRSLGSSLRLYLVAMVLDVWTLAPLGVPFWLTTIATIGLIWLYTFQSGIKTVIWTDTLQTAFLLMAVVMSIGMVGAALNIPWPDIPFRVHNSPFSDILETDWRHPEYFLKMFVSGAFITIVMTGLDQDMMQKNLSCRSLPEAQKNMQWFSLVLVGVNILFLMLGALLYMYCDQQQIALPEKSDQLFPQLAMNTFGPAVAIVFTIGLIAAAYSSADSALTALTTSFCVDILGFNEQKGSKRTRMWVHLGMSALLALQILVFRAYHHDALLKQLFQIAGYTYGPLLGLYAFGIFTRRMTRDGWVPVIAILSPLLCFVIDKSSKSLLNGYVFGFELLILNGALTFGLLQLISLTSHKKQPI
jgi:Na+/proline symporter